MINPMKMKFYGLKDLDNIPQLKTLSKDELFAIRVVSNVLPFRTNNYVVEQLINWDNIPDDPMFQLTFPQKEMLAENHFNRMASLISSVDGSSSNPQTALYVLKSRRTIK